MTDRLHNALHRGPIADGLKKAIGQHKQGEGGLERWGETLTPIVNVWGLPEWAFLRGERLGAIAAFQSAVAAEFSLISFVNPLDSGVIVVVEAANAGQAGLVVQMEVVAHTVIAGTVTAAAAMASGRDRRYIPAGGRFSLSAGTDVGNTFGVFLERLIAVTTTFTSFQNLPVVLKPGDDLLFIGQTVNTAMSVNVSWRERKAFPGELV